jgi:AcrR family transcriptional regulator
MPAARPDERPLRADARRNRERVLDVARTAFAAEGLTVPLDEIARRAGVGPGTLYRHFPTKDALIQAVLLDRLRQLADEGAALSNAAAAGDAAARPGAPSNAVDPGAAFFTYLTRLAQEAGPKRDLFDALASAGVEAGPAAAAAAADVRAHITELLDQAQRAGAVRADIGHAELAALLAGLLLAMRPRPDADPALVLSVFRDGLRR